MTMGRRKLSQWELQERAEILFVSLAPGPISILIKSSRSSTRYWLHHSCDLLGCPTQEPKLQPRTAQGLRNPTRSNSALWRFA